MLDAPKIRASTGRLLGRLARNDGFTMVELMAAIVVLAVGILGAFTAFDASQRLSLVSERHGTMAQIAQQEIERIEGTAYGKIGLNDGLGDGTPITHSTDAANPDYYVTNGSPPVLQYDRTGSATETLDVDTTNGTIVPMRSWTEVTQGGTLKGWIYDFITWSTDSQCSPGCPASQDYKRITVAVTMTQDLQPTPVWVSSVISDPEAQPTGGINNGSGNPIHDPIVICQTGTGTTGPCASGLNTGTANTYFLHDWAATNSGSPQAPSADHTTHPTVGLTAVGGICTTTQAAATASTELNCPVPDLMDTNPPSGTSTTPAYNYSTDQCADSCYPGGRVLQPTCAVPSWTAQACAGTGTSSDCGASAWTSTLQNPQSEFWVTAPFSSAITYTGAGGLSFYTQTIASATPTVSFCVEVYDVPPSGTAGSLSDLFAWPPGAKGGGAYIPVATQSAGNWPTTMTEQSFVFTFSSSPVTIPAGDRLGFRIWMLANQNSPIGVLYDNPNYPSQLQLNSQ